MIDALDAAMCKVEDPACIDTFSGLLTEILMILFMSSLGWIVASETDQTELKPL